MITQLGWPHGIALWEVAHAGEPRSSGRVVADRAAYWAARRNPMSHQAHPKVPFENLEYHGLSLAQPQGGALPRRRGERRAGSRSVRERDRCPFHVTPMMRDAETLASVCGDLGLPSHEGYGLSGPAGRRAVSVGGRRSLKPGLSSRKDLGFPGRSNRHPRPWRRSRFLRGPDQPAPFGGRRELGCLAAPTRRRYTRPTLPRHRAARVPMPRRGRVAALVHAKPAPVHSIRVRSPSRHRRLPATLASNRLLEGSWRTSGRLRSPKTA